MRRGVLGGTFDPVHIGHLIIAEQARLKLGLTEVTFLPAGKPWLKEHKDITAGRHRLEMVELAISSNPFFRVSTLELDQAGSSYTVDTIPALKKELAHGTELYFLVGMDTLAELPIWKEPARLIEMCQLVGVRRPGYKELDLASLEAAIPGAARRIILLDVPEIGISSSEIRERVSQGFSIRYLVPEAVEEYIRENGLYL